jgi:precorrin-4 methylase
MRANAQDAGQSCVDVQIGGVQSYGCINQEMRQIAQTAPKVTIMPDVQASSPAPATGTFNRAATQERLGDAFGHSIVPQRPAAPPPVPLFRTR